MLTILAMMFAQFTTEGIAEIGSPLDAMLSYLFGNPLEGESFFSLSGAGVITSYIQGIALGMVVIMRVVAGVKDGIFANGGDITTGDTVGQWLFRSLIGIVAVCAMPTIFRTFAGFSLLLGSELATAGTGALNGSQIFASYFITTITNIVTTLMGNPFTTIITALFLIALVYYIITILYTIIKRLLHIILLSLVAPLIAINAGTKNPSDVLALLKEAVSIGLISGLQVFMLFASMGAMLQFVPDLLSGLGLCALLIPLAFLAFIKKIPTIIEKYLPVASVSGANGSVRGVAMMGVYAARGLVR